MARTITSGLRATAEQLYRAALTLTERMECGEEVGVKEIKDAAAALKELIAMKNALDEKRAVKEEQVIRVTFAEEGEAWSK